MEVLKLVASTAGYFITLFSLISLLYKPLREKILNSVVIAHKNEEQDNQIKDLVKAVGQLHDLAQSNQLNVDGLTVALQCLVRNVITAAYYKYTTRQEIPMFEKENLGMLYNVYSNQLKGNSYVEQCYKELMNLPIKK